MTQYLIGAGLFRERLRIGLYGIAGKLLYLK